MKSKLLSTFSMLRFFIVAALTVFCVSCDKTETTDSTGFILHYLGVTDIGPGMSYTLQAPTYKGSAPYDFTMTPERTCRNSCRTASTATRNCPI